MFIHVTFVYTIKTLRFQNFIRYLNNKTFMYQKMAYLVALRRRGGRWRRNRPKLLDSHSSGVTDHALPLSLF